tara:strand:+ start:325 stop:480 length:156 start_codon:yes stop_codon:yes gene_type:complete
MINDGSMKMIVSDMMYYNDMDYAEALAEGTRHLSQLESQIEDSYDEYDNWW